MTPPRFALIGPAGSERIEGFRAALAAIGAPEPAVISYETALAARVGCGRLAEALAPCDAVRVESPGETPPEIVRLARAGGADAASVEDVAAGLVTPPGPITRGLLMVIEAAAAARPARCTPMIEPDDAAACFDKPAALARLSAAGAPTPAQLGPVESFEALQAAMKAKGVARAFVKPRFGSAASGVVALVLSERRAEAWTTVHDGTDGGRSELYNVKSMRRLAGHARIARLVDALAPLELYAEVWTPKAGFEGGAADMRLLVIGGGAAHRVARIAKGPITNLHLGARRADAAPMASLALWREIEAAAATIARLYPSAFHLGVDLAVLTGGARFTVFEVNVFGDHLRRIRWRDRDPYALELERWPAWAAARRAAPKPAQADEAEA